MQRGDQGDKKVHSKNSKKKHFKKITVELKKKIVEKNECGICVADLPWGYKMMRLTVSTI